jgi:hypothetical protein
MDLDVPSVAALIRRLPDADLVQMLNVYREHSAGALPGAAAAPPGVRANGARQPRTGAPASTVPGGARASRSPEAPAADVDTLARCVSMLCADRGPLPKKTIMAETSDPSWLAAGWTPERVTSALDTAILRGVIVMTGKNRGAVYSVAPTALVNLDGTDVDAQDDGAPAEVAP